MEITYMAGDTIGGLTKQQRGKVWRIIDNMSEYHFRVLERMNDNDGRSFRARTQERLELRALARQLERELAEAHEDILVWMKRSKDATRRAVHASATRAQVIEECAKVCDRRASKKGKDDEAENEAELCAALIRALADRGDVLK